MADFCCGFVFERDVLKPSTLTIEGRPIDGFRKTRDGFEANLPSGQRIAHKSLKGLIRQYLERTGELANRDFWKTEHLRKLGKGGDRAWNQWRRDQPHVQPMLAGIRSGIDFRRKHLDRYDFSYTNFTSAKLQEVYLRGANFHQAILAGADLSDAKLEGANFCRADLYKTKFTGASLRGANLQGAQLAYTDLRGADLRDCTVYGMSAWDLRLEGAKQQGLVIRYQPTGQRNVEPEEVCVDGMDPAAFMYFALNNRNISTIMNAAGEKWVLILGRFTKRRAVLDRVADALKREQFVPIIFDFERPKQRDLIETVILLAGMSAFVIAELSDPRSVPLELQAIASNYGVPIFPIIEQGAERFGMFPGLRKFRWVSQPIKYEKNEPGDLIARLRRDVIGPATEQRRRLAVMKRRFEAE